MSCRDPIRSWVSCQKSPLEYAWRSGDIHDDWYENRRTKPLEQNIRQGFKHGVRHEEDRQRCIIHARRHVIQVLLEAGNLSIANIRSVQEGEKVQNAKLKHSVSVQKLLGGMLTHGINVRSSFHKSLRS